MIQLILSSYSDPGSMYTGTSLTWIIVIDTKVHFSMKDFMKAELFYGPMLDASHSSIISLFTTTQQFKRYKYCYIQQIRTKLKTSFYIANHKVSIFARVSNQFSKSLELLKLTNILIKIQSFQ